MAHRLTLCVQSIRNQLTKISLQNWPQSRVFSSVKSTSELDDCSAVSEDGRLIACWHPERPILYEHTRPIAAAELDADPGVLKKADFRHLQRPQPDQMVRERLMELTATTKHRWFPRARDKKDRKRTFDREYL